MSARAGVADATRLGVVRTYGGRLRATEAAALFSLGRWDEAARTVAAGLEARPSGRAQIALFVQAARLDTGTGHFAEAARRLDAARVADDGFRGTDDRLAILRAIGELGVVARLGGRRAGGGRRGCPDRRSLPRRIRPSPGSSRSRSAPRRMSRRRARARRDEAVAGEAVRVATARVRILTAWAADRATTAPGVAARFALAAALGRAELARCKGEARPDPWRAIVEGLDAAGRPVEAAYARYRQAEAGLAAHADRGVVAEALRAAHAVAKRVGAVPLATEVATLARLARIELEVAGPGPGDPPHPGRPGPDRPGGRGPPPRRAAAGRTSRSPTPCSSPARRPASTSRTSWASSAWTAGSRPPRSPIGSASGPAPRARPDAA